jgi:integrase
MAHCGLRISEPFKIKDAHFHPDEQTLYIEKTKFNKDRLIPIPRDALINLKNFVSLRSTFIHHAPNLFFAKQGPVSKGLVYKAFHKAVQDIGIDSPRQTIGNICFGQPRPHSLRHSFAVNTLKRACERGRLPENVLPVLAAYMGHTDYRYTMKYLKVLDAAHYGNWVNFCIFKRKEGDP